MATIVTRSGKGSPLTHAEVDSNFTNLNTDKLELSGGTMTGNLSFGDNDKAIFGAGSDLQIYHDGLNSYISDQGTGNLKLLAENFVLKTPDDSTNAIFADTDASVYLYHAGAQKLATTSTGIDVTGTVTADGLTVDGNVASITLNNTDTTIGQQRLGEINFDQNDPDGAGAGTVASMYALNRGSSSGFGALVFQTGTASSLADRMRIEYTGSISFYEDTGTTPKFFWDASAESLGIGTTTVNADLHLGAASPHIDIGPSAGNRGKVGFDSNNVYIGSTSGTGEIHFKNNIGSTDAPHSSGDTKMVVTDSGVGIGTTSPSAPLNIYATYSSDTTEQFRIEDNTGTKLDFFGYANGGKGIQAYADDGSTFYNLNLQPLGGNVGIGTSSPNSPLEVSNGSENHRVEFGTGEVYLMARNASAYITQEYIANQHVFTGYGDSSANEAMRIDSSGNLLVGQVSANSFNLTSGFGFDVRQTYGLGVAVQDNPTAIFNRTNSDGSIVQFNKDGTTVGSIGTPFTGELYIQATGANSSGLLFTSGNTIQPRKNSAADDGNIDIGTGGNRFKDLYLSGGVYLGGTGSANKLDDYEEGTWTPTDAASPAILTGLTNINSFYRKIGDWVYLFGRFSWSSATNNATLIAIGGLPFTDNAGAASPSSGTTMIASSTWNTSTSGNSVTPHIPNGQAYINFYPHMSASYGAYSGSSATGATEVIMQIAYKAT